MVRLILVRHAAAWQVRLAPGLLTELSLDEEGAGLSRLDDTWHLAGAGDGC